MAATVQPQQEKTLLMTEGSIWKSILLFSVPLILGNLLQQLYNTADSIIVGNFLGSNALAAVGSSGSPIYLLIGFSQGVAVGAGVVVSQYLGAKDKKETRIAVHTSLAIAVILGLILTVGGIAVSRSLLIWMNTPEEVLGDAVTYMKLYFGGVLFSVVYNMAAGILNAAGNSRRSVIYLACASITNIILDLVLIAGLKMGVAGAAIATDISQLVSCVLSLRFLMKVDADYKVELSAIRPDQRMTSRIIRIGLPTGIQNMVISFSNVLVQSSVNSYGAAAMAGFAAYMKIDGFNILPVTSFSMAATTFVGQNYGAGNLKRVKNGMWVTLGMGVLYTLCTGALLLAFQNPIMHLFTSDETVVAFGCSAMHYFCPFYFLLAILHGMAGARHRPQRTADGGAAHLALPLPCGVDPVCSPLLCGHRGRVRPLPGVVGAGCRADGPLRMERQLDDLRAFLTGTGNHSIFPFAFWGRLWYLIGKETANTVSQEDSCRQQNPKPHSSAPPAHEWPC